MGSESFCQKQTRRRRPITSKHSHARPRHPTPNANRSLPRPLAPSNGNVEIFLLEFASCTGKHFKTTIGASFTRQFGLRQQRNIHEFAQRGEQNSTSNGASPAFTISLVTQPTGKQGAEQQFANTPDFLSLDVEHALLGCNKFTICCLHFALLQLTASLKVQDLFMLCGGMLAFMTASNACSVSCLSSSAHTHHGNDGTMEANQKHEPGGLKFTWKSECPTMSPYNPAAKQYIHSCWDHFGFAWTQPLMPAQN